MSGRRKILFVCGRNLRRSPTAAKIFRNHPDLDARAAGVSPSSPRRVRADDLAWADLVLVMERKYTARIEAAHPGADFDAHSLEIPDDYEFMDPDLVDLLTARVGEVLARMSDVPDRED